MSKTTRNEKPSKPENLAKGNPRPFAYLHTDPGDPLYDVSFEHEDEYGDICFENAVVEARSAAYAMLEVVHTFPTAVDIEVTGPVTFMEWWEDLKFQLDDDGADHLGWKAVTEKVTVATRED